MSTIGLKYNRWTVISEPRKVGCHSVVEARCDCGQVREKRLAVLKFGATKSCGCLKREATVARNKAKGFPVIVGAVFGRLTVIADREATASAIGHVLCRCECGTIKSVCPGSLRAGTSKSCGCLRAELLADKHRTHGLSKNPLYTVWGSMKDRCRNPSSPQYASYGGRGIKVCPTWVNDFQKFYSDVGDAPFTGASLDRKDNDGDYCKDNIRWATRAQQMSNTSRNIWYTYKGEKTLLKDIAKAESMAASALYSRLHDMGLTLDEALKMPIKLRKGRRLYAKD